MSVALSTDEEAALHRIADAPDDSPGTRSEELDDTYLLPQCVEWITTHNFQRIALQFPDKLLHDSAAIYRKLEDLCSGRRFFILGDTTYCSCCVDEIAAEHASCDSVIHFGPSCLSPSSRLPVALVFPVPQRFDVGAFCKAAENILREENDVVLLYDTPYFSFVDEIVTRVLNLKISGLVVPGNQTVITRNSSAHQYLNIRGKAACNRRSLPDCENPVYLFLGTPSSLLVNLTLQLGHTKFYIYDLDAAVFALDSSSLSKRIMRRYYLIEKFKDAQMVGILIGTLGVKDYLQIIERLKTAIRLAGKKYYTFVMGKPNPPKLANFMEIDIFVYVACPESYFDSKDFLKPVITPHEVEIACGQRPSEERVIIDFRDLLPGGISHVELNEGITSEPDVSLITGSARVRRDQTVDLVSAPDALVERNSVLTISTLPAAHDFLNERSWKGLEPHYGADAAGDIVEGIHGIAQSYEKESEDQHLHNQNAKEKSTVCPCSGGNNCSKDLVSL